MTGRVARPASPSPLAVPGPPRWSPGHVRSRQRMAGASGTARRAGTWARRVRTGKGTFTPRASPRSGVHWVRSGRTLAVGWTARAARAWPASGRSSWVASVSDSSTRRVVDGSGDLVVVRRRVATEPMCRLGTLPTVPADGNPLHDGRVRVRLYAPQRQKVTRDRASCCRPGLPLGCHRAPRSSGQGHCAPNACSDASDAPSERWTGPGSPYR